jgi:hypothetical protein
MQQDKLILTDNHKRSFSSTLQVVEQLLTEIKDQMVNSDHKCCYEIKKDLDDLQVQNNLKVIETALLKICSLKNKYNTDKSVQSLRRIVDTKKTKIWETLHNSKSRKMKGYGEFVQKTVKEYDKDIEELMEITEKITF